MLSIAKIDKKGPITRRFWHLKTNMFPLLFVYNSNFYDLEASGLITYKRYKIFLPLPHPNFTYATYASWSDIDKTRGDLKFGFQYKGGLDSKGKSPF